VSEHLNSGIQRSRDVFYMFSRNLFQRTEFRCFEYQTFGCVGHTIIANVPQLRTVAVCVGLFLIYKTHFKFT